MDVGGHHPICEEPRRNKRSKKRHIPPFPEQGRPPFPAIRHGAPGSPAFGLQGLLQRVSQLSGLWTGLNCTTCFSGSPARKQQVTGLLGLHNLMKQFLYGACMRPSSPGLFLWGTLKQAAIYHLLGFANGHNMGSTVN